MPIYVLEPPLRYNHAYSGPVIERVLPLHEARQVCARFVQGFGYIRWPAESFMISETKWVYYGGGMAIVGILLVIAARR